jgi:hypothetical protein
MEAAHKKLPIGWSQIIEFAPLLTETYFASSRYQRNLDQNLLSYLAKSVAQKLFFGRDQKTDFQSRPKNIQN